MRSESFFIVFRTPVRYRTRCACRGSLSEIESQRAQAELRDVEAHADTDVGMPDERVEVGGRVVAVDLLAADDARRAVVTEEHERKLAVGRERIANSA